MINQLLKFLEKVYSVRFHSRGQRLYKLIGTKVSVNIRKEFNSHRTGLGLQHGGRDVMWIARLFSNFSLYLQMITHLLRTHLFMEPVAVACRRQLPSLHPLWKLLAPHVRGVMAINTLGRERLIPAGGVADNTLSLGGGGKSMRGRFLSPILSIYFTI